jgi:hypothetical protein
MTQLALDVGHPHQRVGPQRGRGPHHPRVHRDRVTGRSDPLEQMSEQVLDPARARWFRLFLEQPLRDLDRLDRPVLLLERDQLDARIDRDSDQNDETREHQAPVIRSTLPPRLWSLRSIAS